MLQHLLHSARALELFSEPATLQAMLDFESTLAAAQAGLGIIPAASAEAIASCCHANLFDLDAIAHAAARSGNLAIPMVLQLTALVREQSAEAAGFVHYGATSQDAIDTGLILQLRSELDLLDAQLSQASAALATLTIAHRETIMPGRTWLQQAVPITFGLKTAGWLDALLRHRTHLHEVRQRVLVLQFGGAAGTLASLGDRAMDTAAALSQQLRLPLPLLPWHASRDRIAEAATFHGLVMGSTGKIARDLALLMQTEVGEAREAPSPGRGGSSTMPHKRNPIAAAVILSSAIRVPGLVSTILSAMPQEHERGLGGWHAEWETLPEICTLTLGALEHLTSALEGLEVFPEAMAANLDRTHGLLLAEAVSMDLAQHIGKDEAHKKVEAASRRALNECKSLHDVLLDQPDIMQHLSPERLSSLLNPANYTGAAQSMIDSVLSAHQALAPANAAEE